MGMSPSHPHQSFSTEGLIPCGSCSLTNHLPDGPGQSHITLAHTGSHYASQPTRSRTALSARLIPRCPAGHNVPGEGEHKVMKFIWLERHKVISGPNQLPLTG